MQEQNEINLMPRVKRGCGLVGGWHDGERHDWLVAHWAANDAIATPAGYAYVPSSCGDSSMSVRLSLLFVSLSIATVACQRIEPSAPSTAPDAVGRATPAPTTATPRADPASTAGSDDSTYSFTCGDLSVRAVYHGVDAATATVGDRTLRMDHVESGSGARYTDAEGNEFWTKGVSARVLPPNGQPERNCTGTPAG